MKIVLPWPDKRLTPNAKRRKHWRTYQPAANNDRHTGFVLTIAALNARARQVVSQGAERIPVTVTFYPPDLRRRDDDSMIGAFKHQRDGIADALGIDDARFRPNYVIAESEKPGRVEVEL